jgi:hypothetical protein
MTFWGEKALAASGAFRCIIVETKFTCAIWISSQRREYRWNTWSKNIIICSNKDLAHILET